MDERRQNPARGMTLLAEQVLSGKLKPYLMAHRGNRATCPENTLAAFQRAIDEGADILETDLHLTRDGVFVCIHDAAVDRTTDGQGAVTSYSLEEIKQLRAGEGWPGYLEERIPTLKELAAILPEHMVLALELKTDLFLDEAICAQLADELDQAGIRTRTMAISFSLERLKAVKRAAPDIMIGLIALSGLWPRREPEFVGVLWPWLFLNPFYVWIAHRRGQFFCPLDPSPDSRLWFYRFLKCDSILSDNPGETLARMGRAGMPSGAK
ncbi:MAG: hypothetical protein JXA97_10340 [Anaerolineales bacterium]|nr:hypothetical protein [Anaerolineales bacterium]